MIPRLACFPRLPVSSGQAAVLLALLSGITSAASAAEPFGPVQVTVTAKGCEPVELTVPAGSVTFQITNKSSRLLEWEILKGVIVVDERENIAPGFKQKLTTKLDPGSYEVTCGLLTNPKGQLTVTANTAATALTPVDFVGPVAEYRVATVAALSDLDAAMKELQAAGSAGDRTLLKSALTKVQARVLIAAPILPALGEPGSRFAGKVEDLVRALSSETAPDLSVAIDQLASDYAAYRSGVQVLVPARQKLIAATVDVTKRIASKSSAETLTSADLDEVAWLTAGVDGVVGRFAALVARADAAAAADTKAALARMTALVAEARTAVGTDPATLKPELRQALANAGRALAETTGRFAAALGS